MGLINPVKLVVKDVVIAVTDKRLFKQDVLEKVRESR
jgi:hypothetical protein